MNLGLEWVRERDDIDTVHFGWKSVRFSSSPTGFSEGRRLRTSGGLARSSRTAVAGAANDTPVYQTENGERTARARGHKGFYAVAFSPRWRTVGHRRH